VEGKKCRAIGRDWQAVSEVYGQLLMISIVVLSFSTIALTVFSDGGAVDPPHTPRVDLREEIDTDNNKLYITHSGGEAIDLSAIKLILVVADGQQYEFSKSDFEDPDGNEPDDVFTLGDCIVINDENIKSGIDIDMLLVYTPSQQVIQRTVLQRGPRKLPDWITPYPYGSVYDNTSGWLPMELVSAEDGLFISSTVPKSEWISHTYSFGLDADEMGISNFSKIQLKIIYKTDGDSSFEDLKLEVYNGSEWIEIASESEGNLKEHRDFNACKEENEIYTLYDSTENVDYIKNTDELEKLMIRFSVRGNADEESGKKFSVDYVGIHIE
jgi:FlaG/FlaF family flagellin (archaellin)